MKPAWLMYHILFLQPVSPKNILSAWEIFANFLLLFKVIIILYLILIFFNIVESLLLLPIKKITNGSAYLIRNIVCILLLLILQAT